MNGKCYVLLWTWWCRHGQTHVHCHCWYLFFIDVVSLSMWFEYELVLSINTRESCRKSAFYAVKGSKTQDLPSSDVYLAWKNLCKKFGWSSDQERNEDENCKQEAEKGQEKSISEENIQVKNRSPEDEAKPSEDIENQSIEVNMTTTSSKKEEDENFQVLTKWEENVTCTMGPTRNKPS